MVEYGVFNDEGCIEQGLWSAEEANAVATSYQDAGDDEARAKKICHTHDGRNGTTSEPQPADACPECANDDADTEEDTDSEDEESDEPARVPYDAKHTRIVDMGTIIEAVWVSDPSIPLEEALEKSHYRDLPYEVEIVATATRYYKYEGADFSGWVVSHGNDYTDSLPNKREALKHLRYAIADHFKR